MHVRALICGVLAAVASSPIAMAGSDNSIATPMVFSSNLLSPTIVGFAPSPKTSVVSNQFSGLGLDFVGQDDPQSTAPSSFLVDTSVLVALAQINGQAQQFQSAFSALLAGPPAGLGPRANAPQGRGSGGGGGSFGGGGGSTGGGGTGGGFGGPGGGGTGGPGTGPGGGTGPSVSVTAVPLPLPGAMLGLGLLSLGLAARRRQRSKA